MLLVLSSPPRRLGLTNLCSVVQSRLGCRNSSPQQGSQPSASRETSGLLTVAFVSWEPLPRSLSPGGTWRTSPKHFVLQSWRLQEVAHSVRLMVVHRLRIFDRMSSKVSDLRNSLVNFYSGEKTSSFSPPRTNDSQRPP